MSLIVPAVGQSIILQKTRLVSFQYISLYSNDYTPIAGSLIGDFTYPGGLIANPISTDPTDWTVSNGNPTYLVYNSFISFTSFLSDYIYGYVLWGVSGASFVPGTSVIAQRFDQPFVTGYTIGGLNRYINIKPHLALNNS